MPLEFPGLLLPFTHHHLLIYGPDAAALGEPLFGPPVFLRPGYHLVTGAEYLLPTEAIDDIGQHFLAPDCYAWIEKRGHLFPRADVIGLTPTGETQHVFMKELDLAMMAVFASPVGQVGNLPYVRVNLAIEALASPDGYALTPTPLPLDLFSRALPCYRLAPGVFGALGAAILNQLLATRRRDWRLTFDELDDLVDC